MIGLIPAYFNSPSARYTPAVCVVVLLLNAWAVGKNSRPGSVPFIPDTRKPSRNIQPSLIPAAQPNSTQETAGGGNIFSPSTNFSFDIQPANHPHVPSSQELMQTKLRLFLKDDIFSGSAASGGKLVTLTLDQLSIHSASLTNSARVVIQNAIVLAVNKAGVSGVACLVRPASNADEFNSILLVVTDIADDSRATPSAAIVKTPPVAKPVEVVQAPPPPQPQPPEPVQPPQAPVVAPEIQTASAVDASQNIFSQSTDFAFEMEPANHPRMPTAQTLMSTSVTLYQNGNVYSGSATSNSKQITLTLDQLAKQGGSLTDSAPAEIEKAIVAKINDAGISGVQCLVEPAPNAQSPNSIKVVVAQLAGVRTIASGVRGGETGQSVDSENHAAIKQQSPLRQGDVLQKEVLEDYLYSLSRFPGRTVSAAVSSEPSNAQVVLDYYIQEKKIFDVYASVSNTGTTETSKYQERVGLLATQLTNNDDILSIDYQNSNFSGTQNVNGYYDARIGTLKDFRWRVTGQWGQYYSSDLGLAAEDFNGSNWGIQGEVIWTFLQKGNAFFDLDLGVKGWNAQTENNLLASNGNADFITLTGFVNALATGETWALQGSVGGMYTTTNANQQNLDDLGRLNTSSNFTTLNGSVYGSFYLDPLLDSSWKGSKSIYKPLVHEIFGSLRGQYAFDYRLTPLSQYTMGGLYTVRGFAQSITAGDNALVGTIEYRMHLPRMFTPSTPTGSFPSAAKPFRWAPDSGTGASPDWDLVLSGFFDAGRVYNNQSYEFEANTPMYSAGVGLDLTVLQNISVGIDWGWALNSISNPSAGVQVDSGSSQFWFTATIVY